MIVTCSHFSTRIAGERGASRGAGGRGDADADAALSRRRAARRRGRHARSTSRTSPRRRPADHGAGRAAGAASRCRCRSSCVSRARCRAVRYFKIEVPGTAAKLRALIEAGGDADRRAVRRRGVDHADGRPRRRRDRDDVERAAARPHQAGGRAPSARAAGRKRRPRTRASCRSSTTRTGSAGCAPPRPVMTEGGVIRSDAVRHPLEPLHPATRAGLLELAQALAARWRCAGASRPSGTRASPGRRQPPEPGWVDSPREPCILPIAAPQHQAVRQSQVPVFVL